MLIPKIKRIFPNEQRTRSELVQLILAVDRLLLKEQKTGKGKLKTTIQKTKAKKPFCDFPVVFLPAKGEVVFIGDTHGDSLATTAIIKQERCLEKIEAGKTVYIVFLGDYADRGKEDIKNLELVLSLKKEYPDNVLLLRGNHEEVEMGQYYGLLGSSIKRFGYERGQNIFQRFNDLFEHLPGVVVTANGIVALHGGVPVTHIKSLNDLDYEGVLAEIRWNDPTDETKEAIFNYKRGGHYLFGKKKFDEFMKAIGGKVLVRGHEYFADGYDIMFSERLLSVFSNGGLSPESGYRDFIITPQYAKVNLEKPIIKWTKKHVFEVKY